MSWRRSLKAGCSYGTSTIGSKTNRSLLRYHTDPQTNTVADLVPKALDSLSASDRRQVLSVLIQSELSLGAGPG